MFSDKLFNKRNHLSKTIAECMDEVDVDLDGWIERTKEILNRPRLCQYAQNNVQL